ncbi:hypothetical protein M885DRAFT_513141 [Pelagophyceae sp. CCMP2097]|nr:hypothetical protein M885DRAFT_513141 [Pelagophyceae sp. CCMP2097]
MTAASDRTARLCDAATGAPGETHPDVAKRAQDDAGAAARAQYVEAIAQWNHMRRLAAAGLLSEAQIDDQCEKFSRLPAYVIESDDQLAGLFGAKGCAPSSDGERASARDDAAAHPCDDAAAGVAYCPAAGAAAGAAAGVAASAAEGNGGATVGSTLGAVGATDGGAVVATLEGPIEAEPGAAMSGDEFARLAAAAISSGRALDLCGRRVEVTAPLLLRGGDSLCVSNGTVVGSGHSVFQSDGTRRSELRLVNLFILHESSRARLEDRMLGAAVYARGKARVVLEKCTVRSTAGFGLWLQQRAVVSVDRCRFERCGRSSIGVFEKAALEVSDSVIADAAPHGICARGSGAVRVVRSLLENAEDRAIYCYQNATLNVEDSLIRGTRSDKSCAVQVDALRDGEAASVSLFGTVFENNVGGDLDVKGNVQQDVRTCGALVERCHAFPPPRRSFRDDAT